MKRGRVSLEQIGRVIAVGILLLLVGCASAADGTASAPATARIPDSLRPTTAGMAATWGVTMPEAYQRLRLEDAIGTLQAELAEWEADTFAGLWVENEPYYHVVVAFTRRGERTIEPYLENRSIPGLTLREARFTFAELQAMQAQASRELTKLDFGVTVAIAVQDNRVEVYVSDRAWFESELDRVAAQLPQGVELVIVEGASTARDKELLLTPPVPGIAFPRQKPTEGIRESMLAELIGTLRLDGACLQIQSLGGQVLLPIWPPEFTLRRLGSGAETDQVLVIDGQGQMAARCGEEVYMGGGYAGIPSDEWVLQQVPAACLGECFVVGNEVRPNLRHDSQLFALDVIPTAQQTVLFLRYKPALDQQIADGEQLAGKLVAYDAFRCLHLETDGGAGRRTLLWPFDWSVSAASGEVTVLDGTGQIVAGMGDDVFLRGRAVPHSLDSAPYAQLVGDLPGDCIGASWLVDGVQ